jgi:hypothetical protein
MAVLDRDRHLLAARPGLLIIADKGYASAELNRYLADRGTALLRPAYRNRAARPGQALLAPIRQLIESVNDTLKGQLDLELHGGRSLAGVTTRVAQRLLAFTAAIWHNPRYRLNRPGIDGGFQPPKDGSHGGTQEVPRRAA